MATATITRGYATWVQGAGTKVYSNAPGGNAEGDWTFYLGRKHIDYTNDYCAAVVAFTVPSIIDTMMGARSISIPCTFRHDSGNTLPLYARLSTTAPGDYTTFNNGPSSGIISNEVAFNHDTTTLTFTVTDGVAISGKTIYLYLYTKAGADLYTVTATGFSNGTLTYSEGGVIYISNGTSFDAYQIFIDNGSSWDPCVAYIDNGSSWDRCG